MNTHATRKVLGIGVNGPDPVEQAWLQMIVEAEQARQEYTEYLRSSDREESELGRLWLRLWQAERRRDELFRNLAC
jgi:hypothetical protein